MNNFNSEESNSIRNAPYRSSRRASRKGRVPRGRKERRLTVRSELREQPDVRKIAKAIIAMAMVEAEREAQAQAEREERGGEPRGADVE